MSDIASARQLDQVSVLERRLARAQAKVDQLESMIEDSTRSLFTTQMELRRSNDFTKQIVASMENALFVTDADCRVILIGGTAERLLGRAEHEILDMPLSEFIAGGAEPPKPKVGGDTQREVEFIRPDGSVVAVLITSSPMTDANDDVVAMVNVATDLTERHRLEHERRRAQKLESIGQLAAGVAHEINTPIQFIGDSTRFLGEVVNELVQLADLAVSLVDPGQAGTADEQARRDRIDAIEDLAEQIDLDFVRDEVPRSVERTIGGVRRVSEIVAALKQFAHPGTGAATPCDVAEIIKTTLVVASNEYRYHADVITELEPTPPVLADPGDLSQAVLNLVVNAGHAIADRQDGERGRITVRTRSDHPWVVLEVEDTGTGIAPEVRDRIFDPFFTTKEVGRGTGQGLAIVASLVERHGGRIEVDSVVGQGTTFRLLLSSQGTR